MSSGTLRNYIILTLVCSLILSFYGCSKKDTAAKKVKSINVAVRPAETKSVRSFIETVGTLTPYDEVSVSTEVDGIIGEIMVDEGTVLNKGMLIAVIKDTDYSLELIRAKAALRQAESHHSNISLEYERKKVLYDEGHLSQQDYDSVLSRLTLADAERDNAAASLSLAEHRLTKTRIYSPISGVVKTRSVSAGSFIRNGASLCIIIQVDQLKLNFSVSEQYAGVLRKGQDLLFRVESYPDREFSGKIGLIYPDLDEKTRTLMAEADVDNQNGILKPGFFATIKIYTTSEKDTVLIPATALIYEGDNIKVFTVTNEIARERRVITGAKYGELMEIRDGLKAGDIVVVAGQQNLSDGISVNVAR